MNLGNAGNRETQSMACQLLAIRLLKEYNTRELIDSLSYDFYPLQGAQDAGDIAGSFNARNRSRPSASRISTLEIAIRAQAKHFLAHPLVVQQLEAIWAGTIVFHTHADHLHRTPPSGRSTPARGFGTAPGNTSELQTAGNSRGTPQGINTSPPCSRRSVTIYDPRNASLFKLSRLRVPRYRQFFNSISLIVLLTLFVAVLIESSTEITRLEVVFWLWSAGFMLDEIVGFNEQGFSLYIMSFWNTFDLGILLLLVIYYGMRIYGILLVDHGSNTWNGMAYDVLAANAVLLFPRLFSVLDHYRYFSQLLIAFRLMAVDLVAVLILILVSCSGFFVTFAFAFGTGQYEPSEIAYQLFQIWIGFTPAAWEAWENYNILGRAILALFLFISHFLTVTILVSVLSNSFMAIVANADAEHQFVFAVNTISMVKNDSLFSYMAPSNLIAWILTPLRYLMPFRGFIKLNRYVIKVTHFPLLLGIYGYERIFLARKVYEPTDLIEGQGRGRNRIVSLLDPANRTSLFSPTIRLRQESTSGYHKDRALEEVFRLSERESPRSVKNNRPQETRNVVKNWMDQHEGVANSPLPDNASIVKRLERRGRQAIEARRVMDRHWSGAKSLGSITGQGSIGGPSRQDFTRRRSVQESQLPTMTMHEEQPQTADEGDDELGLATNDEDDTMTIGKTSRSPSTAPASSHRLDDDDYFRTPTTARFVSSPASGPFFSSPTTQVMHKREAPASPRLRTPHTVDRTISTNTVVYNPAHAGHAPRFTAKHSTGAPTPTTRRSKPRSIPRFHAGESAPDPGVVDRSVDSVVTPRRARPRHSSSLDFGLGLVSQVAEEKEHLWGGVPSSFTTGMVGRSAEKDGGDRVMERLMLAKMKTLEEGIQEVVRELAELRVERERERAVAREGSKHFSWRNSRQDGRPVTMDGKGKGKEREWARESVVGSLD